MATGTGTVNLPEGYSLEGQPSQQTTQAPAGLPEGYSLEQSNVDTPSTGSFTNDVGNQVIVPKDGESFEDTMKRAAAHGKTVKQVELNKEISTIPKKAGEVLASAPLIGAGLPAMEAGASEGMSALHELAVRHLAGVLPELEGSDALLKQKFIDMAPKILKTVKDLGIAGGGIGLLFKAMNMGTSSSKSK